MITATVTFLCLFPCQSSSSRPSESKIPSLLKEAFYQRQSFDTAFWELRIELSRNGFAQSVQNKSIKWKGDSFFCRDEGDDDGMLRYLDAHTGEVPLGIASSFCAEERVLDSKTGSLWARSVNSPFTTLTSKNAWLDFVDPRSLGLRAIEIQRLSPKEMLELLEDPDGLRFGPPVDRDDLTIITGWGSPSNEGSYYEYEWVIDRKKGPSILVSRQYLRNKAGPKVLEAESRCQIARFNERWWPIRIEFDMPLVNSHSVYEFRQVAFDLPNHPGKIDADILGLPIGAPVIPQGHGRTDRYMGSGGTVDDETWKSIRAGYDLSPYREFSDRAVALGRGEFPSWWTSTDGTEGISDIGDRPDQWEAYVRRWVMRRTNHHAWRVIEPLTNAQRTTSKGILDGCRNKAAPIRARLDKEASAVAAELAAAEAALTALKLANDKVINNDSSSAEAKKAAFDSGAKNERAASEQELHGKIKALKQRKAQLTKSPEIERIFDELKARLEGMLTTKQKDPANGSFQRPAPPPMPQHSPGARPTPMAPASSTSRPSVGN